MANYLRLPLPRLLPLTMLAMLALLVLKSGDLVLAATAEPAPTAAAAAPAVKPPVGEPPPAAPMSAEKPALPAEQPVTDSERALLADLRQRRQQLDAREQALAARETALAAVAQRLDGNLADLAALQAKLEGLEQQRQAHDEANWRGMVKLYETMKPREAATIFNDLDQAVLLPVLDRMKEAKAAAILAAMQPDRARQVTADLAQLRVRSNSINPAAKSASGG